MLTLPTIRNEVLNTSRKQCKDMGLLIAGLMLIAGIATRKDLFQYLSLGILCITLIAPVLFYPFAIVWFGFSRILGYLTSRFMLIMIFILVVTPVAIIRRMLRKDELKLNEFKKGKSGVFIIRNHVFTAIDLKYPY